MENNNTNLKETVVVYHADCPDGFAAAYAAWKKFGDSASYIPQVIGGPMVEGLKDKDLYILDLCYTNDEMNMLESDNRSVMTIDHHASNEAIVSQFPGNIFDQDHGAGVLTWNFFHPGTEVPQLLKYVEDRDLWNFNMKNTKEFDAALQEYEYDFNIWDKLIELLSQPEGLEKFLATGKTIVGFENRLVKKMMQYKEKVEFEGYTCYAVNASRVYRSLLAHRLATLNEKEGGVPMGIVYHKYDGNWHCSVRGNGDFSVIELVEKHGGGGHARAAAMRFEKFEDLPFKFL